MAHSTVTRFEDTKQLKQESSVVTTLNLEEAKLIEHAKNILMRQRNLDADQAHNLLQEMATKRNTQVVKISSQLVKTSKMLIV